MYIYYIYIYIYYTHSTSVFVLIYIFLHVLHDMKSFYTLLSLSIFYCNKTPCIVKLSKEIMSR